jgi:phosphomannomutase
MRSLVERADPARLVLIDGVKVLFDDGWVMALPDPGDPITHVWAEAASESAARGRAQEYGRRIAQLVRR